MPNLLAHRRKICSAGRQHEKFCLRDIYAHVVATDSEPCFGVHIIFTSRRSSHCQRCCCYLAERCGSESTHGIYCCTELKGNMITTVASTLKKP